MKILIDDGLSSLYNLTGIGHHGYNLYIHLKQFCECEITNYWYLKFIPRGLRKFTYEGCTNLHSLYRRFEIIHYQNHNLPYISGHAKRVVTIHDLSVYRFPETVPTIYIKHNQSLIFHSIKMADAIITPSEFTKEEIIDCFPEAKYKGIYSCEVGLRDIFFEEDVRSDIFIDNNLLHYSYFFFIGSISKRKNLEFLLTAFTKAKENGTIRKDTKLVLGGQNWWGASNINKMINSNLDIISLGYLSDSDIINLYRYSKAVIFPSIYEGFGMPIIEAMSQNAPLIISDIPTSIKLNERHGNQMFMFKLGNEPSLMKILNNLDKNFESIKSKLNYNDISIYRYENIAKRHLEVYNTLL